MHVPTRPRRAASPTRTLAGGLAAVFVLGMSMQLGIPPAVGCLLSAVTAIAAGRTPHRLLSWHRNNNR